MYDKYCVDEKTKKFIMEYGMGADFYLNKMSYNCTEVLDEENLLKQFVLGYEKKTNKTFYIKIEFEESQLYMLEDIKQKIENVLTKLKKQMIASEKIKDEYFKEK